MNINEELYDLAERFLANRISDSELEEVNALLANSLEFNQYITNLKEANETLMLAGLQQERAKISIAQNGYFQKRKLFQYGKWIGGISIVLSILLGLLYNSKKEVLSNKSDAEKKPSTNTTINKTPEYSSNKSNTLINQKITSDSINPSIQEKFIETPTIILEENKIPKDTLLDITKHIDLNPVSVDPCNIEIKFNLQTNEPCQNKNDGSIILDKVSGGTPPYTFSTDKKKYEQSNTFRFLTEGNYSVTVKDAKGCISKANEIHLNAKICEDLTTNLIFSYQRNEDLKLPESTDDGFIEITNNKGQIVFSTEIKQGNQNYWNGLSNEGQRLPMGLYWFLYKAEQTKISQGTITILD